MGARFKFTFCIITICLGVVAGLPASIEPPLPATKFRPLSILPPGEYPTPLQAPPILRRQPRCDDPSWEPSPENWVNEGVDEKLAGWWTSQQAEGLSSTSTIVDLLSTSFGDMSRGQECGIGKSNCFVPDCQPFQDNGGPKWVYFVRYAFVQMSDLFQNLYDAANTAEEDFTPLILDLANGFFQWNDPSVKLREAQPWITAGVESVLSFINPIKFINLSPVLRNVVAPQVVDTTKEFAAAGTTYIGGSGDSALEHEMGTVRDLGELIKTATQDLRESLDAWSNTLFSGQVDATGRTIIDYLRGGRFTLDYMSASEMSDWMFKLRIAWLVNRQWLDRAKNHSKKFVMCANSTDIPCNDTSRYTEGGRACCLYTLSGKAKYENATDFAKLQSSQYRFSLSDITASALHSYLARRFNYSTVDVNDTIMASISPDDSKQFYSLGIKAPGIFTIPVCDVGEYADWVVNWNSNDAKLPCCCGVDCSETRDFYNASAMYRHRKLKDADFKSALDDKCSKQFEEYNMHWSAAVLHQHIPSLATLVLIMATGVAFAWYL
ncbi:uncharacterized protein Z518_00636 [Rhinocladiella mackenziei CBS 650.93]|uniref:Uncharacterized protein n=1 Tax=Rhinocladiella mackenziei CBS 650.93 TaxID=1442369 RepID=A0A0D2J1L2_9EURO|nr:uncharacterized protein Z518_00636 [Rhinocladiella mackenziei CBS 650.93]KIX09556.1 hypothetical protein Z518_00636 [Rhinocladiella mackenziei CBS 650.93]